MKRSLVVILAAVVIVAACSAGTPGGSPDEASASPSTATASQPDEAPSDGSPSTSSAPGTQASPRAVEITVDDQLALTPNVVRVTEGETVAFHVNNAGTAPVVFTLGPIADVIANKSGTPQIPAIEASETKSLTFSFTGPGPFIFAGHEPARPDVGTTGYILLVGPGVPVVGTATRPRLLEVDISDRMTFSPSTISVAKGETVTFVVANQGLAPHEFAIGPAAKVDADEVDGTVVKEAEDISSHLVRSVTYTFDGPGPYSFACHVPGHFEAGMRGSITFHG
jgi:uncharacterized cupredoxin-like copper-binding protein